MLLIKIAGAGALGFVFGLVVYTVLGLPVGWLFGSGGRDLFLVLCIVLGTASPVFGLLQARNEEMQAEAGMQAQIRAEADDQLQVLKVYWILCRTGLRAPRPDLTGRSMNLMRGRSSHFGMRLSSL